MRPQMRADMIILVSVRCSIDVCAELKFDSSSSLDKIIKQASLASPAINRLKLFSPYLPITSRAIDTSVRPVRWDEVKVNRYWGHPLARSGTFCPKRLIST
jgi:hypothetical protein